jgi:RimJ/RimL family protein N-acetyltransferase
MRPILTTRLELREFRQSDWKAVQGYASDSEVVRYMEWGPNTEKDSQDFIKRSIAYKRERPRKNFDLAVVLRRDGTLIGGCGIYLTDPANREGYIGYVFNRKFWGRGYATETARALVEFGFHKLNLHRIFSWCDSENLASARVMEKIGMTQEAYHRQNKLIKGKWRNTVLFAILEDDNEQV